MLDKMKKTSVLDFLPSKYISDSIKSEIAQKAQRRLPRLIGIPSFVRPQAMDYWHFKNANSKATLELEI